MNYIEELLYEKTKGTKSEILFTQWSYDKKIIPKALNSISNLFPHYSLHDESHSINIINNMIRVLGRDSFSKLSSIDLWLILSSSYYHDIGMFVPAEELIEALESKSFLNFFKDLLEDEKDSLHEYAKYFKVESEKIVYGNSSLTLSKHDGIKFILAEYFRRQHSLRSENIIIDPNKEFNISSPRNAMPQRIFKTLGKICSCHTRDFESIMNLSFCEVGIDTEDMHPRFIACLLRIGDLLDLDNDRFSDVMLSTLSIIPLDTLNHKSKHMSIESFRCDKNEISIFAKCDDYDIAEITQHWFDYINNEFTNQMLNWNKIVPSKDLGYLPSIESLNVELSPYEYIDGRNKPKFSVDTTKALDLLRGSGIYEKPIQTFREILQNAIDSTLIRVWEEHKSDISIFEKPYTKKFKELILNYPINVNIISEGISNNSKVWRIEIEDSAMGISTEDLKYLMNAGSSYKNKKKKNILREMPKWLKPSGIFGIGFQSIFQITEKVAIETKDFFNEQYQKITLYSPDSKKNGAILLQKKDSNHVIKPGTKLIFNYNTKTIPYSYSLGFEESFTRRVVEDYDYFSHESFDVEMAQIIDEVYKFTLNSYFPIKLKVDNESISLNGELKKPFKYFDEETSLEFNIYPNVEGKYALRTYFKNQIVEKNSLSMNFISLDVNIHTDKASDVVTLNRNEIKNDYSSTLTRNIFQALFRIIPDNYNDFNNKEQEYLSAFLNFYYDKVKDFKYLKISKFCEYKKFKFEIDKSIDEILDLDEILYKKLIKNSNNLSFENYEVKGKKFIIKTSLSYTNNDMTKFLLFKVKERFTSISIKNKDGFEIISLRKTEQKNPYRNKDYKNIIKELPKSYIKSRMFIPCMIEKFPYLRVKDDSSILWVFHHPSLSTILNMPKMLSPFIIKNKELTVSLNSKVYDWVYENRYYNNTTKDDIIKAYELFVKKYK